MENRDTVNASPLSWPAGWPRARQRTRSRFGKRSMASALDAVYTQLSNMGVGDWNIIVSSNVELRLNGLPRSNQKCPADSGVAVYFRLKGERHVLACDRWNSPEENLWAICKHVEALRGQERWGVGSLEQAFGAYKALPAQGQTSKRDWWCVLGFDSVPNSLAFVRSSYRSLSKSKHPDTTFGSESAFRELGEAWTEAKNHFTQEIK